MCRTANLSKTSPKSTTDSGNALQFWALTSGAGNRFRASATIKTHLPLLVAVWRSDSYVHWNNLEKSLRILRTCRTSDYPVGIVHDPGSMSIILSVNAWNFKGIWAEVDHDWICIQTWFSDSVIVWSFWTDEIQSSGSRKTKMKYRRSFESIYVL